MGTTINWGIIGPGKIARKFASDLKYVNDANLMAVASRSEAHAKVFAEEYRIRHGYNSYEALVENPDIDIVYIASPHPFHREHAFLAMTRGKAVLCEKPLAMNSAQVAEMINVARKQKVFLMEGMWTRFFPAIKKAEELVKLGMIGEIKSLHVDFGFYSEFDPKGRLYDPKLGGGSLLDVGVYPLFLAQLLLGKPEKVKALSQFSSTGVDVSTSMVLNYNSGATALLSSSIICNTPLEATISGTTGSVKIESPWYSPSRLKLITSGGSSEFSFPCKGHGFYFEAQEAVNCLQSGMLESPLMPHNFSKDLMEVMDQVRSESGISYPELL